jgi:DNA-binding transcriptional MerR regulator
MYGERNCDSTVEASGPFTAYLALKSSNGGRMRPVDMARAVGLSTQAVRNYEAAGILPPAARSETGYRRYTDTHLAALHAFMALVPAVGHASARAVMVALSTGHTDDALERLDQAHAQLLTDRATVRTAQSSLETLTASSSQWGRSLQPQMAPYTVGELAHRIGVTPTALRSWERAGILAPARAPDTGHRRYQADDIRDADIAHLLRRGGVPLQDIAVVVRQIRTVGSASQLQVTVKAWRAALNQRACALLDAATAISTYLATAADR